MARVGQRLFRAVERARSRSPARALARADQAVARLARWDAGSAATNGGGPRPSEYSAIWQVARLLRASAHALRALGRHAEAARRYAEASARFRRAGDAFESARCTIGRVDALMYLGRYAKARSEAAGALPVLRAGRDRAAAGRLLNNVANMEYRHDRPVLALAAYARARRELRRASDPVAVARVDANRGNCLVASGRPDAAARLFRGARRAFERAHLPVDALACDYALAYLLFAQHRYADSLFALARLEQPAERLGAQDVRMLLDVDAAEIHLRLASVVDAEIAAARGAARAGTLGLRYERAKARYFEAVAQAARGLADQACDGLRKAMADFSAEGNLAWVGQCHLAIGECELARARAGRAAIKAARAVRVLRAAGDAEREGLAWVLAGRAALRRRTAGGARTAGVSLGHARRLARRSRSAFLKFRAACLAGDAALAGGRLPAARRAYAGAIRIAESLARRVQGELFRATDWTAWEGAYPRLVAVELEAGRPEGVFQALERARARAFEVRTGEGGARRVWAPPPALEKRLRALSCRLEVRGGGRAPGATGLAPSLSRSEREAREVARWLEQIDREAGAALRRQALPTPGVARVSASLGPDEVLIECFEAGGRLGLLLVASEGPSIHPGLSAEADAATWGEEIRYLSSRGTPRDGDGPATAVAEVLDEIASRLLLPLALRDRGVARAIVVPSGRLAALPWPALLDRAGVPECCVVPSGAFWLARRAAALRRGAVVLVGLGDADAPEVRREITLLSERLPRARVLLGAEATVRAVRHALGDAAWLHMAGHGRHDRERPVLSGIRLADRWAHLTDLAPATRGPRAVVLAACQTGEMVGGFRNDWQGLAGGLLRAGSRAVLASLWDVPDQASRMFVERLYDRLLAGDTLARALGSVRAERRDLAEPWSLFGVGDARFEDLAS